MSNDELMTNDEVGGAKLSFSSFVHFAHQLLRRDEREPALACLPYSSRLTPKPPRDFFQIINGYVSTESRFHDSCTDRRR